MVACPEAYDIRMISGKPKLEQVKRTGAAVVAAACENCRLQLTDLGEYYGAAYTVTALADLVVKAMRLPGNQPTEIPLTMEAPEMAEIAR